jgi:hypothetical protein
MCIFSVCVCDSCWNWTPWPSLNPFYQVSHTGPRCVISLPHVMEQVEHVGGFYRSSPPHPPPSSPLLFPEWRARWIICFSKQNTHRLYYLASHLDCNEFNQFYINIVCPNPSTKAVLYFYLHICLIISSYIHDSVFSMWMWPLGEFNLTTLHLLAPRSYQLSHAGALLHSALM